MPNKLTVSFVIPTLNEASILAQLLDSIACLDQSETVRVQEIIVVDAASIDETAMLAKEHRCTVLSAEPGRIAASRNQGAAQASGNILAFIDADCQLPSTWLIAIASELQNEDVVAVGSIMAESLEDTTWVERAWFDLAHRPNTPEKTTDVEWLPTFNLAVKKAIFEAAGQFDETLTTCEDVDFGYRISSFGRLRRINSCGVVHKGESKTLSEFRHREAWRARGAIASLVRHWRKPREIVSFLLPIVMVGCLVTSVVLTVAFIAQPHNPTNDNQYLLLLAGLVGPVPIILLTVRRGVRWSMLIPCGILMCFYFFARLQGMLRSFARVPRTERFD